HITYLNNLQKKVPDLVYVEIEARASRERLLRRMEEAENGAPEEHGGGESLEEDDKDVDEENRYVAKELGRINRAFKTIEILGQILKNYSGSMKGDLKSRLARECVSLSLRSMNYFLRLIDTNLEGLVADVAENYVTEEKISNRTAIAERA